MTEFLLGAAIVAGILAVLWGLFNLFWHFGYQIARAGIIAMFIGACVMAGQVATHGAIPSWSYVSLFGGLMVMFGGVLVDKRSGF